MRTLSLIVVTFSLLTLLYTPTDAKTTLVEEVCSRLPDPNCPGILRDVRASSASNLTELGGVLVQMELETLQFEKNMIGGLRRNRGYPPYAFDIFDYCDKMYDNSISICDLAREDIGAQKYFDAKKNFEKMGDTVYDCTTKMVDYPIERILRKNEEAFLISSIGVKVMGLLLNPSRPLRND